MVTMPRNKLDIDYMELSIIVEVQLGATTQLMACTRKGGINLMIVTSNSQTNQDGTVEAVPTFYSMKKLNHNKNGIPKPSKSKTALKIKRRMQRLNKRMIESKYLSPFIALFEGSMNL